MAANLTETAIRGLKTKSTAYYVWSNSAQRGTGRLGVKVQPSGSKVFYFRYYVEKGKKEKFIQLGIWPEMKLVTANELAKKYGVDSICQCNTPFNYLFRCFELQCLSRSVV
ncbi:hypothetical protein L423_04424 [Enterobacter roggenkampii]|nr:hypothetical protein L423_04424 [Enterobacter roggenkampii]